MDKKWNKQEQQTIWITYKNDDGELKSAPLETFQKIAQKRNWKPKKQEENI